MPAQGRINAERALASAKASAKKRAEALATKRLAALLAVLSLCPHCLHTRTHTLSPSLDEIKGTQNQDSCSFSDSLSCHCALSLGMLFHNFLDITIMCLLSLCFFHPVTVKVGCLTLSLPFNLTLTLPHSHTLLITCTCCYDLTKGTQNKDFSYSFFDSLSFLSLFFNLTLTQSHTHTHTLSFVPVVVMKPKELKTKISHAHSLIPSHYLARLSATPLRRPLGLSLFSWHLSLTINFTCSYYEIK